MRNGALLSSTAPIQDVAAANAALALQRAFPGKRVCIGETDGLIGFGVVFSDTMRHAVRVGSYAEAEDAISLLRAWEDEHS